MAYNMKDHLDDESSNSAMGGAGCIFYTLSIVFAIVVGVLSLEEEKISNITIIVFAIFVICAGLSYWLIKYQTRSSNRRKLELFSKIEIMIEANRDIIAKESLKQYSSINHRKKRAYTDSFKEWIKSFIENFIKPKLDQQDQKVLSNMQTNVVDYILDYSVTAKDIYLDSIGFYEEMSGSSFEYFCMRLLARNGWKVENTTSSGDQGVDILASRSGLTLAIQCKRYKKSVGNKAVQEALAGAKHYKAMYPVVVTNAKYTRQAHDLANSTEVLLLHFSELEELYERIMSINQK